MKKSLKDKIKECLHELYMISDERHLSYCSYPIEECSCRDIDKIDENTSLISGGWLDSMGLLLLVVKIEEDFGIKIKDEDISPYNFDTIKKIEIIIKKYIVV